MVYSKYDSDPDYVIGNTFSRVGLVKNPTVYGSQTAILDANQATNLGALKLQPVGQEIHLIPFIQLMLRFANMLVVAILLLDMLLLGIATLEF